MPDTPGPGSSLTDDRTPYSVIDRENVALARVAEKSNTFSSAG